MTGIPIPNLIDVFFFVAAHFFRRFCGRAGAQGIDISGKSGKGKIMCRDDALVQQMTIDRGRRYPGIALAQKDDGLTDIVVHLSALATIGPSLWLQCVKTMFAVKIEPSFNGIPGNAELSS